MRGAVQEMGVRPRFFRKGRPDGEYFSACHLAVNALRPCSYMQGVGLPHSVVGLFGYGSLGVRYFRDAAKAIVSTLSHAQVLSGRQHNAIKVAHDVVFARVAR